MAQGNDLFPPIEPDEVETITFDFGRILAPGVSISSVLLVSCLVTDGSKVSDPTPAARLIGSPQIIAGGPPPAGSGVANAAVAQLVGTCIDGCRYRLEAAIISSDGQTLSVITHLPCDKSA